MADHAGSVRCAVYTRKSSEEGLEQSFNSLHAQREACEAYILSQKHEGWQLWPKAYDDGGYSGGTMDRPGLKQLLADVRAGLISTIVVYKVDRLSRSLSDFAKMVDLFEEHKVSFVSVTQAFNTTSSMGRLTLNMLLSFAQFEREVTGERIRDKIAASKAKGMWMGGIVPLGYDVVDRQLVINHPEADQVRHLFELYRKHKAADTVVAKAAVLGVRSKRRKTANGTISGDAELTRGSLYRILSNRIYVGEIKHREKIYPGQHEGIVDPKLFAPVQQILTRNRRKRATGRSCSVTALLRGLVFDPAGSRLGPTHTSKNGKRYRYYANADLRVRADELEALVLDALRVRLSDASEVAKLLPTMSLISSDLISSAMQFADTLERSSAHEVAAVIARLVSRIVVSKNSIDVTLKLAPDVLGHMRLAGSLTSETKRLALIVPGNQARPDPALILMVAKARSWFERLINADQPSLAALAAEDGTSVDYIRQVLGAAFLAPDILTQIVEGRQPSALTATRLRSLLPLPNSWEAQRAIITALN